MVGWGLRPVTSSLRPPYSANPYDGGVRGTSGVLRTVPLLFTNYGVELGSAGPYEPATFLAGGGSCASRLLAISTLVALETALRTMYGYTGPGTSTFGVERRRHIGLLQAAGVTVRRCSVLPSLIACPARCGNQRRTSATLPFLLELHEMRNLAVSAMSRLLRAL